MYDGTDLVPGSDGADEVPDRGGAAGPVECAGAVAGRDGVPRVDDPGVAGIVDTSAGDATATGAPGATDDDVTAPGAAGADDVVGPVEPLRLS